MENQRKKILYIITKSNFGGAQRYVFELATVTLAQGFDVVVAFGGEGVLKQKLEEVGIKTRTIKSFDRDIHLGKELRVMTELYSLIKKERPDVVHLNSSKAGGSGACIARLLGVKQIIFTAHGWPFFEERNVIWKSIVWFLSWVTVLLAHKVILVSEHDRKRARMPFAQHKFEVIHTGVGEIPFLERSVARAQLFPEDVCTRHADDLWIVSTSEHTKNKNLFMLLNVVREHNSLHDKKIFLTFMGEGEDKNVLEQSAEKNGMKYYVFFTGFVSDAPTYLKAFDIFVLPSLKEGMPYGLLEAGAAGLSVIASNVGGIPEVIHNNENGILINPKDVQTLTTALDSLGSNIDKSVYGAKLKEVISSDFSIAHMLAKTIALYR